MVTVAVPRMRVGLAAHLQRFRDQAAGHPGFEAVARIHTAQEQLLRGGSAVTAMDEVEAALAVGLPPAAATNAAFLALWTLELGERYDLALRLFGAALEGARRVAVRYEDLPAVFDVEEAMTAPPFKKDGPNYFVY